MGDGLGRVRVWAVVVVVPVRRRTVRRRRCWSVGGFMVSSCVCESVIEEVDSHTVTVSLSVVCGMFCDTRKGYRYIFFGCVCV